MKRDEYLNVVRRELDLRRVRYSVTWGKGSHRKVQFVANGRPCFILVGHSNTADPRSFHNLRAQVRRAFRDPATGTGGV